MLRNMNDLKEYEIVAIDGSVGSIKDFLFDDFAWVVRYFVVETGNWLLSKRVLLSPIAIQKPNWGNKVLPVSITQNQVENSPDINTAKPVSRQHEIEYLGYYGYPLYWSEVGLWGDNMYPCSLNQNDAEKQQNLENLTNEKRDASPADQNQDEDSNLRSCTEVMGYHVHATDGDIGHISELLVEEGTWAVRYLVVDTTDWWGGYKVLITPECINEIIWVDNSVTINLSRESIKKAPLYQSTEQLNRHCEGISYKDYGLTSYWARSSKIQPEGPHRFL